MRAEVAFANERIAFDVPDGAFLESFTGPPDGLPEADISALIAATLESPTDFPPLRQAVVPGDRVVIALDAQLTSAALILDPILSLLERAGVESESILIVTTTPTDPVSTTADSTITQSVHDPDERDHIAYLATTRSGRRIYLNRYLTDADFVLPIGELGFVGDTGFRGPWSVLFPSMSDSHTLGALRTGATVDESEEVSWLLGSQFHIGILPGKTGLLKIVAGQQEAVRREGIRAIEDAWKFQPSRPVEVVVAGVGGPSHPGDMQSIAAALANARRAVRRGGKIAILSRSPGSLGPALRKLAPIDDPRSASKQLRGLEAQEDYVSAKQLADAISWADVYLLSSLGEELTEDLAMIALAKPEESRRLVATAESCLFLSAADKARVAEPTSSN
jgi:nickel-dependent lactate racemase